MFLIAFPHINPVAIKLGPVNIHWYALAYVCGILCGAFYAKKLAAKFKCVITAKQIDDFISPAIIGIILGGRLGYILFYDPLKYLYDPIEIFKIYQGGMSFHGGIAGLLIAAFIFCRGNQLPIFALVDILAIISPIGLFLGRIANFINAEAYGRITTVSWAIIFPYSDGMPRHPSQIYEAIFEGLLLLILMSYLTFRYHTLKKPGYNSGIFLIFYALSRIIIENFREPDIQLGFFFDFCTMGQILSMPMLIFGMYIMYTAIKKPRSS